MSAEREKFEAVREAGQRMSNLLYNLAQQKRFIEPDASLMNEAVKEWDVAKVTYAEARPSVSGLPIAERFYVAEDCAGDAYFRLEEVPLMHPEHRIMFRYVQAHDYDILRVDYDAQSSRIVELERQLADMTEDRDLWMEAHDGDCPNIPLLEAVGSKLAVCREETIKECAEVAAKTIVTADGLMSNTQKMLLSKLPASVAEKKS